MMEIYDRVLPSRSLPTLAGLAVILLVLYLFHWFFDTLRSRILIRLGSALDQDLGEPVFQAIVSAPIKGIVEGDGQQPQRDLDQVRNFLSSGGPAALFDLPWIPLYLTICYVFHPWIGLTATAGGALLIAVTLTTEVLTRKASKSALPAVLRRNGLTEAGRRNSEIVQALGMCGRLGKRWGEANQRYVASQRRVADIVSTFGAASKVLRMTIQSAVLGVGAMLVIDGRASPGVMIASSIIAARALAPVEQAIANWKGFIAARQGWARLRCLLADTKAAATAMPLPPAQSSLAVEAAASGPPGSKGLIIQDVSFTLNAGSAVGIIGPSGSGKSSLARMLVGVWPAMRGKVRFDGWAHEHWDADALARNIGYLPQDVELLAGSIADNIARFDPEADPQAILAAAKAANVHELVQRLPDGFNSPIGEGGAALSAGQRQRIALARALYGNPFIVVLDEPNSNLDAEGEHALTKAIEGIRARAGIAIVIAHRPNALVACDYAMMMHEGRVHAFGPKEEVLRKVLQPVSQTKGSEHDTPSVPRRFAQNDAKLSKAT